MTQNPAVDFYLLTASDESHFLEAGGQLGPAQSGMEHRTLVHYKSVGSQRDVHFPGHLSLLSDPRGSI